jgi:arginase
MARPLAVVGVPSGAGACGVGQEQTPTALRRAGLIELLGDVGFHTSDLGDSPVVPWHPDRARPRTQNLDEVVEVVRSTTSRVADALRDREQTVLVLGGDCTVGIGTIAGARAAVGDVAVVYFDLHADLNTPASARDGALDWMALAHMLALEGSEPALVAATGRRPLLQASQVVLFAHSQSDARASNAARSSDSSWPASHWRTSATTPKPQLARRSHGRRRDPLTTSSTSTSTSSISPTPHCQSTHRATRASN